LIFCGVCVISSCKAVVQIVLQTVDFRQGVTSAIQLIPKLWPFLSHSIKSVRRAALRTMSVLLATSRLKVSETEQLLTEYCMLDETGVVVRVSL